jgi:hypothetical protein
VAGGPGFEPGLTESESAVLPLNYPPPLGGDVLRRWILELAQERCVVGRTKPVKVRRHVTLLRSGGGNGAPQPPGVTGRSHCYPAGYIVPSSGRGLIALLLRTVEPAERTQAAHRKPFCRAARGTLFNGSHQTAANASRSVLKVYGRCRLAKKRRSDQARGFVSSIK